MFDALNLADESKIEDGIVHHLYRVADDGDKVLLYLDADKTIPCQAIVRSRHSKIARALNRNLSAKAAVAGRRAKAGSNVEIVEQQIEKSEAQNFAAYLVALVNCDTQRPGRIDIEKSVALEMAEQSSYQWLVEQVVMVANDDALYGLDAKGNADAPKGGEGKTKAK